jgi:hypothetical protein
LLKLREVKGKGPLTLIIKTFSRHVKLGL